MISISVNTRVLTHSFATHRDGRLTRINLPGCDRTLLKYLSSNSKVIHLLHLLLTFFNLFNRQQKRLLNLLPYRIIY